MVAHIGIGGLHQLTYFIIRNGFDWVAVLVISTSFHLYNDKQTVLLRYNINLLMPKSPVTITYSISTSHKIGRCTVLTYLPVFIVLCHYVRIKNCTKLSNCIYSIKFLTDYLRNHYLYLATQEAIRLRLGKSQLTQERE